MLRHEPHLAAGETLVLAAGSRALAVEVARRLGRTAAEWLGRAAEHRLAKYVEAEAEWARRVARARKEHERKRARAGGEEGGEGDGDGEGHGSATMMVDVGPGADAGGAAAAGGFSEASVRGARRPDRTDPYVLRTLLQEGFALPAASTGVHDMQLLRAFLDSYKDEVPDKGAFDSLIDAEAAARVAKRRRTAADEEGDGEGGEEGRARGAASSSSAAAGTLPWVPSPLSPPRSRWRGYRARQLPASVARGGAWAGVGAGAGAAATDAFFRAADSDSGEAALGAAATPVKGVRRGGGVEETKGGDEEE